jgi:hypothetical protein
MDDFGESEATVAIVVYRQENGLVSVRATQEAHTTDLIGMLQCAHAVMLHDYVNQQYKPETPPE